MATAPLRLESAVLGAQLELTDIEGRMPYSSNATLLARSEDGRLWIYKPEQGENPLWDFTWRTLAKREVLAYEMARAMGLDLVPETLEAEGPLGPGSAQAFVEEDLEFDLRTLFVPTLDPRLWPFAVLDVICNNADRKLGHLIRTVSQKQLWAIDNGLTFHHEPKLRTVLWGFAGQPIPDSLRASLTAAQTALETGLWMRISDLLSPREADAVSERLKELIIRPQHPHPPEDRPAIPWPLW
ncbi:MAG TPA: phosphatidylinositol kinase [Acidimicrobiia bacterium]|nr:phosphatidylinositol kinase [Acidimicrobiia bacterium]